MPSRISGCSLGRLSLAAATSLTLAWTTVSYAQDVTHDPKAPRHKNNRGASRSGQKKDTPRPAAAHDAQKKKDDRPGATEAGSVEHLRVVGSPMNTLQEPIGLGRMPQDVLHTPQTINVVPKILMEQQNVKSLDEALRNVPGVTSSVGEGEGGMSGDQFLIRGFQAQNDIYENGLRDFGVYTRDSFDYDHISVIKGPSSEVFGNGTTGGAINITTKVAHLGDSYSGGFSGGSGQYYRGTLDFNKQIGESTAIRITGMGNENNTVGRDHLYSHRWGIAPSIAFGLGKPLTYTIEYFHQTDNRIPDYGVPVVTKPGTSIGLPVTEYGIKRTNWYGTTYDQDASNVDMLTGRMKYDINSHITLYNDTRGGMYERYFSSSQASCDATCTAAYFGSDPSSAMISRRGGVGGPEPYQQNDWSVQNVFSGVARFSTGSIRHQMIAGWDVSHVYDRRTNYAYNFNGQNGTQKDTTSLVSPSAYQPGLLLGTVGQYAGNLVNISGVGHALYKTGDATDVGAFFSEQMWLLPVFSIKGGFRWDHWNSHYSANGGTAGNGESFGQDQDTFNPTVSLMYTPNDNTMVYFNWAQSTTPLGLYVTNSSEPLKSSTEGFKPERSSLYELGAKYNAFHGRMGFAASVFRLEKGNSLQTDAATGDVTSSSDRQRNQGVELSISGEIMKNWTMIGTYAFYDAKTLAGTAADVGKRIQYAPKNSATIWSTYTFAPGKPYNLMFGGGLTWREGVWLDAANTARVPATVEWDAVISHNITKRWRVAMNGYNLDNRLNYGSLFSNRATPSIGRSFLFNISANY
ncbi:TonB-dependent receptor [Gluconobacter morbifer]|nr:TonB-dependent receptor [Gluconobacter morbifer]